MMRYTVFQCAVAGDYCRGCRHYMYMYLHEERDEVLDWLAVDASHFRRLLQQQHKRALLVRKLTQITTCNSNM